MPKKKEDTKKAVVKKAAAKTTNKKSEGAFFDDLMKAAGVDIPVASKVDEVAVTSFFSTGSMALNALLSGSLDGGFAGNKITALAGEEATGKTFIALQAVATFLKLNPKGHVFYFDSEDAITESMMLDRGIDTSRVHKQRVNTIQDFRYKVIHLIDAYLAKPEAQRLPMFLVLDSLGNLSTLKELHDTQSGKLNKKGEDTRDMTRTPLIRGLFRVLTIKLGEAKVALLMTNHTYASMNPYGPSKTMSGGGGLKYAASTIVFLSKKSFRDEKDKKEVLGSILTATLDKSRFTRYGKQVDILLRHDRGLDQYYGLFDLGKKYGLIKMVGKEYTFPDGQQASRKDIAAKPADFFDTPVNRAAFEEMVAKAFLFGKGEEAPLDPIESDDEVFEIDQEDSSGWDSEDNVESAVEQMEEQFEAEEE